MRQEIRSSELYPCRTGRKYRVAVCYSGINKGSAPKKKPRTEDQNALEGTCKSLTAIPQI